MNQSYLTAGIRFTPLIRLLARNHITPTPVVLARIGFLIQSAVWSSLFARVEKARYAKSLDRTPVPRDPLFIVGHWRTGSTFLHQLLNQHPELSAPTLFQVALPDSFLVSYRFYQPLFSTLMGSKRPMDNVRIGMDEPQEDEYALYRLTTHSPLEQLVFPSGQGYFLNSASFLPPEEDLEAWKSALQLFYRKISFQTGKQIVSKNPFNSFRIPLLASLFPQARFIHIIRHPYSVIPSTRHLWNIVHSQNRLNNRHCSPTTEELTRFYGKVIAEVRGQFAALPASRKTEIRYEDLEQHPIQTIRSMFDLLEIFFPEPFGSSLNNYLRGLDHYQKNRFTLPDQEKQLIEKIMAPLLNEYRYA